MSAERSPVPVVPGAAGTGLASPPPTAPGSPGASLQPPTGASPFESADGSPRTVAAPVAGLRPPTVAPFGGVVASAAVLPPPPPGTPVLAQPGEILPSLDSRLSACGEDAEWFKRLPPEIQERVRAQRAQVAVRSVERHRTRKHSFGHGALRGAAVFLVTHLMFGFGGFLGLWVATSVGALLGTLWTYFDAGPLKSAVSAAPVYAAVWMAFGPKDGVAFVLIFFASLIVMSLSAAAGTMREFRQSDGQE